MHGVPLCPPLAPCQTVSDTQGSTTFSDGEYVWRLIQVSMQQQSLASSRTCVMRLQTTATNATQPGGSNDCAAGQLRRGHFLSIGPGSHTCKCATRGPGWLAQLSREHQDGDGLDDHVQVVGGEGPVPGVALHHEGVPREGDGHPREAQPRRAQPHVPDLGRQRVQLLLQLRLCPAPPKSVELNTIDPLY